jgi:carboxylesterase type B
MSPVAFESNDNINASAFFPDCPQTAPKTAPYHGQTPVFDGVIRNFTSQTGNPQSENCLGLNVWVKNSSGKKAVLVWFHGGSE